MPLYLINPAKGGTMPRKRRARRTAAQRRATAKLVASNRKRRRGVKRATVKRRRPTTRRRQAPRTSVVVLSNRGRSMARRKRRAASRTRGRSTTRRRRSYRRNAPILATVQAGAVRGIAGLAGSAAVRYVSGMVPAQANPWVQSAIDVAVGSVVAIVADKAKLSGNVAAAIATGAMMRTYESVLKRHLPPTITQPLLGESRSYGLTPGGGIPGQYGQVGAYPAAALPAYDGVGAYPGVEMEDYQL